ncbi:MAG: hydroxyacylglutathione hydrolase family protein [Candidatus Latescibacterota bacterium]
MILEQIPAGGDRNFSYGVADEDSHEAAVVDPGFPPARELDFLQRNGLILRYIINTHGHSDHTGGNEMLAAQTGSRIAVHASSRLRHDIDLRDGDVLRLGNTELHIIHTPGHTADSLCILVQGNLITGDTLFVGKVGGTGYGRDARDEYESLHRKLLTLPPETHILPGHDYGVRPSSRIGDELRENPFILRDSFESFLDLKKNWAEYKRVHGIK